MTAPWVDYLIDQKEAPLVEIIKIINCHGAQACINALFDEGSRCQHSNLERASACVRLIGRIEQYDPSVSIASVEARAG